jgi:DnaJ-domain-containing protein 1
VFLGSREDVAHLGYVLGRCPKCGVQGVFTVYEAKRKITVSLVVALPAGQQQVLECRACGVRFALPAEMRDQLKERLISADQLADYVGRLPADVAALGNGAANGRAVPGRTLYQVLQVDPDADPDVIEAAFKRLALKYHPDRSPAADAAAKMRELIAARDVLVDATRRRAYDASIGIVRPPPRPPAMRADEV